MRWDWHISLDLSNNIICGTNRYRWRIWTFFVREWWFGGDILYLLGLFLCTGRPGLIPGPIATLRFLNCTFIICTCTCNTIICYLIWCTCSKWGTTTTTHVYFASPRERPWHHWVRPRIHAATHTLYALILVFLVERVRKHARNNKLLPLEYGHSREGTKYSKWGTTITTHVWFVVYSCITECF